MVLWHEFDDNVATVASITTGMSSFRQNNAREGRWFKLGFGLLADGAWVSTAPTPAVAIAGVFQLPFHREPPQKTLRERCEQWDSQREHRNHYGTLAFRNAQQMLSIAPAQPLRHSDRPGGCCQCCIGGPDKSPPVKSPPNRSPPGKIRRPRSDDAIYFNFSLNNSNSRAFIRFLI